MRRLAVLATGLLVAFAACGGGNEKAKPTTTNAAPAPGSSNTVSKKAGVPNNGTKPTRNPFVWPEQVKKKSELLRLGMSPKWHDLQHAGNAIVVAIETMPTSGESYINLYAYVYNRHFREWRQFFAVKVRGAGGIAVRLDAKTGRLEAVGTANNDLKGKAVFMFDLAAVYDDR